MTPAVLASLRNIKRRLTLPMLQPQSGLASTHNRHLINGGCCMISGPYTAAALLCKLHHLASYIVVFDGLAHHASHLKSHPSTQSNSEKVKPLPPSPPTLIPEAPLCFVASLYGRVHFRQPAPKPYIQPTSAKKTRAWCHSLSRIAACFGSNHHTASTSTPQDTREAATCPPHPPCRGSTGAPARFNSIRLHIPPHPLESLLSRPKAYAGGRMHACTSTKTPSAHAAHASLPPTPKVPPTDGLPHDKTPPLPIHSVHLFFAPQASPPARRA